MSSRIFYLLIMFLNLSVLTAQVDLGGLMKDKAKQAQKKAADKALEKSTETWEKQRKEYDESNFNYSICFFDNSSLFEAQEKGNAFAGNLLSGSKLISKEEKSLTERAYTNLKNGELLFAGNKYYLAEQSFKLAKFQYEQSGDAQSINYTQTLSNLGLLYQSRGRFNTARPYHEKALELRRNTDNKNMLLVSINNFAVWKKETGHFTDAEKDFKSGIILGKELNNGLSIGLLQNNLALTYADMNKLKEAEKVMLAALLEAGKFLDPASANFIRLRINLAGIYRLEKKYREAEEIYLSCLQIKEKKLGAHPDLAQLKKGLAQLYMEMGKNEEVEKLLNSALDINTRKLGPNNPATVATLHELANFHRFNGQQQKALEEMVKVTGKYADIYGEKHPVWIQGKEDLALAQWENKQLVPASDNYRLVMESTLHFINEFFSSLNENEKTKYWDKTSTRLQRYFNFAAQNTKLLNPGVLSEFYRTLISTKGFLINSSTKIRTTIMEGTDEELKLFYSNWLSTKENINRAYQLSKEEQQQEKVNMDSLIQVEDALERKLSEKSEVFKTATLAAPIDVRSIQSVLSEQEAVIELLELNIYQNGFNGKQKYLALVLTQKELTLVELGPAEEINHAIEVFRQNILDLKPQGKTYQSVWKNLEPALSSCSKLYISLDGNYHQLSLMALKNEKDVYLIDQYTMVFLANSRDLPAFKKSSAIPAKPKSVFLIGNPKYGTNAVIEQLPGAEKEIVAISSLFSKNKISGKSLIGEKATEQSVKTIQSPGVLHVATHGYFLSDVSEVESSKVIGIEILAAKENPLLRSGLLFANCENVFDPEFRPEPGSENGILTAYEVLSMNLDKTELVVLSACETGLGDIKQGEGVYGLQRSFLIAGAKSLVMSLWSVSDEATMHLMNSFYGNYLKSGDKVSSFYTAVKQLKLKYPEPFFWSAFVMLNN